MVFSSPIFLFFFLPIVIGGYYLMPRVLKNGFLLLMSLIFYAYGAYDFLIVLLLSMTFDYLLSLLISGTDYKKVFLIIGVIFNLLLLAYFKYANFFVHEFGEFLGMNTALWLEVILPLGISFFTFHKISYLVDVYKGSAKFMKNPLDYALYILFFPQLIAGPIIRYYQIADQIRRRIHNFNKFFEGVYSFALGLFMKVVIADNLGIFYRDIFDFTGDLVTPSVTSFMTVMGILAFAFQIYFDFAGYSKMAIGMGRMFGFEFPANFNRPYLAGSITEFWRRWHMTLTGFFREYVYIPLGGNRSGSFKTARNLFIVFLLTGIWHGANWTFILWGIYFGILIILEKFVLKAILEKLPRFAARLWTFLVVFFGWMLFVSPDIGAFGDLVKSIFSFSGGFNLPVISFNFKMQLILGFAAIASFVPFSSKSFADLEKNIVMRSVVVCAALFLSFIAVAGSTFHPFLYFTF